MLIASKEQDLGFLHPSGVGFEELTAPRGRPAPVSRAGYCGDAATGILNATVFTTPDR